MPRVGRFGRIAVLTFIPPPSSGVLRPGPLTLCLALHRFPGRRGNAQDRPRFDYLGLQLDFYVPIAAFAASTCFFVYRQFIGARGRMARRAATSAF